MGIFRLGSSVVVLLVGSSNKAWEVCTTGCVTVAAGLLSRAANSVMNRLLLDDGLRKDVG